MPKPKGKPKAKPSRLFSGKQSEGLWQTINGVKKCDRNGRPVGFSAWDVHMALYAIAWRCLELETRIEELERQQPPDPVLG